ncbi:TPA: sigma-70 family RNA polymerase sigma factor [Candidatus Poribacteria bacterium]|nr:sigma-70 family RNA polymerase sigma factor [Candidatus Poribacteria bacterium]
MEPDLENVVLIDETFNLRRQTMETDAELVERCKAKDVQAFEALFMRYQTRIYNFIFYQVQDAETAADLTQEVFFAAWRHLSSLRANEAFSSWLYQIAKNQCRNFQKKRRLKTESLEKSEVLATSATQNVWEIPDESKNPEKLTLSAELQTVVEQAISELKEKHRTVIILHYIEGLGVGEIAEILGISQGTVKSRLARAREKLSEKLAKYED